MRNSGQIIHVRAPFDFALTVGVARRLPSNTLYRLRDGELRFVASLEEAPYLLGVRQDAPNRVAYHILGASPPGLSEAVVEGAIRRLLGMDVDLTPLDALMAAEPIVGPLYRRLPGMGPPRFLNLWETVLQVIPFQQVSLAAALAAVNRLAMAFGPRIVFEGEEYIGAPPVSQALTWSEGDLRQCGLSAAKARAVRGCAERLQSGALREDALAGLSTDAVTQRLQGLPGIGPWSAQLIALRGLGRLDVFPAGDSGATRGLRELFKEASDPEAEAAETLARLGPWRGYLYFLLLARRLATAGE